MDKIADNDDYLDLFSIISTLYKNKFLIILSIIVGVLLTSFLFYERVKYKKSYLEINFTDQLVSNLEYDFKSRLIDELTNKTNIENSLRENNSYDEIDKIDYAKISMLESSIALNIVERKNINFNIKDKDSIFIDPVINVSLTHTEETENNIDIGKFLSSLVIEAQYSVLKKYIKLLEEEINVSKKIISEEKLFINSIHDKQDSELQLLGINLMNQENKRAYKIRVITEALKIAKSLDYVFPQIEFESSKLSSETIVMSTIDSESMINREIELPQSPDIFSYSINQGIPLYLFGSNILESELLILRENTQYENKYLLKELENYQYQIDQSRLLELEEISMSETGRKIKQLESEVEELVKVKKNNSLVIEYNDTNFLYSEEVPSNLLFKVLIGAFVFFVISCIVILFKAENERRKLL